MPEQRRAGQLVGSLYSAKHAVWSLIVRLHSSVFSFSMRVFSWFFFLVARFCWRALSFFFLFFFVVQVFSFPFSSSAVTLWQKSLKLKYQFCRSNLSLPVWNHTGNSGVTKTGMCSWTKLNTICPDPLCPNTLRAMLNSLAHLLVSKDGQNCYQWRNRGKWASNVRNSRKCSAVSAVRSTIFCGHRHVL